MPTALIVEDEPAANKLLSMLVRLRGYQPESAFSGGEALEKVGRHRPDIVFLDLMLPDTDGYDICQRLKADRRTSLIPVVMVTARLAEENRLQGFQAGADAYIPKPYTPDQIFGAMAAADAWRRTVEQHADAGALRLDARPVAERARELSRLRSLLLARTALDEEAVARLVAALRTLWTEAGAWGEAHGKDPVATVSYRLQSDRLTLCLRDEAGWFQGPDLPPLDQLLGGELARCADEARPDASGREVELIKWLPAPR